MKNLLQIICLLLATLPHVSGQVNGKYMPPENKFLLILGQDLGAVGGFEAPNNDGYYENVEVVPGGVTTYTGLRNLGGLYSLTNWGSGDVCGSCITENSIYDNSVVAIGLYMVDMLTDIVSGELNEDIIQMGEWIKSANRPVYLRIGYEFNLQYGNDYANYIKAYRHIVNTLNSVPVYNYVSVWQSHGHGSKTELMKWYPGDEYVDWLGYSHFDGNGEGILEIAREKNKPVMICEATPRGRDLKTEDGETVWNAWFNPMFSYIEENSDVIKALAYINADWDSQPMWEGQGWGDSRVEVNDFVLDAWLTEITQEKWLNSSPALFDSLGYEEITGVEMNKVENNPGAYYYNGQIHLQTGTMIKQNEPVSLRVMDSAGRQLFQSTNDFNRSWPVDLKIGYYIALISINGQQICSPFYSAN